MFSNFIPSSRISELKYYCDMARVALNMVISTMHEKSCIDLHNTRIFFKQKFQYSFVNINRNHNAKLRKILDMDYLNHLDQRTQLFKGLFPSSINFVENYRRVIYKVTYEDNPHVYVTAFIFCADLMTPGSLWRRKGVPIHVTHKTLRRFFFAIHGSPSLDSELSPLIPASWCSSTI